MASRARQEQAEGNRIFLRNLSSKKRQRQNLAGLSTPEQELLQGFITKVGDMSPPGGTKPELFQTLNLAVPKIADVYSFILRESLGKKKTSKRGRKSK